VTRVETLRVSLTTQCDLHCSYCRPRPGLSEIGFSTRGAVGSLPHDDGGWEPVGESSCGSLLSVAEVVTVVRLFQEQFGLRKVRLTGGEPLLRPRVVEVVRELSRLGVEVAMTTNGQRLAALAGPLREAGLTRVNVSLDTLDPARFRRLAGGGRLLATLRGLKEARRVGLAPVKTNTVVLRGVNEGEVVRIATYALERGFEPRFLELMSVGAGRRLHPACFVSGGEILDRLSSCFQLAPLDYSGRTPARRFTVRQGGRLLGRLGVIAPETRPFCHGCRRLRLTARGELLGCLMQERGIPLAPWLRGTAWGWSMEGSSSSGPATRRRGRGRAGVFVNLVRAALARKPGIRRLRRRTELAAIGG